MHDSLANGVCLALALDAASKVTEQEWREKAKKDLEEWNLRQNEQMEKNRANNRYVGVSMAMRAAMGAAVQPDLGCLGPSFPTVEPSPAGMELCQARGCEWLRWLCRAALAGTTLGSWCVLPPLHGPHPGAGLGHCVCRLSWCCVSCGEWVTLSGRTLTPCVFLSL